MAPEPAQTSQVTEVGILIVARLAVEGLLERDLEVVAHVGAALAPAGGPRRAARLAEEILEDVRHEVGEVGAEARAGRAPPLAKAAWPKRS